LEVFFAYICQTASQYPFKHPLILIEFPAEYSAILCELQFCGTKTIFLTQKFFEMKKMLLSLALGVLAIVSVNAQTPDNPPGTPVTLFGLPVFITGTMNGVAVVNQQVLAGSAITMVSSFTYNGQMYGIAPTPQPNAFNPLQNILYSNNVVLDLNGNNTNNVNFASTATQSPNYGGDQIFGTQNGNFTVVPIPFDFGISAVLGAGAVAAVKTARRRRKEQQATA